MTVTPTASHDDPSATVDLGQVHVLVAHGGPCQPECPHADHRTRTTRVGEWGGE